MDSAAWVTKAVEALRFATEKEILRWLDEEGENFSRLELATTLQKLVGEGKLECKTGVYRPGRKHAGTQAFDKLFGE